MDKITDVIILGLGFRVHRSQLKGGYICPNNGEANGKEPGNCTGTAKYRAI